MTSKFSVTMEGPKDPPRWISFNGEPMVIRTVPFLFDCNMPVSFLVPMSWALTEAQNDAAGPDAAVGSAASAEFKDQGLSRDFRSKICDGFWLDNPRFHYMSRWAE
ncbi:hypothetical protein HDU86_007303 [Geranomyces michiganensis]|nr:hypothetical protein HDU86_007303 [Geranomyces michiganensis]